MNLYYIKINSAGLDWSDSKTTEGEITLTDGKVSIKYTIDGDECLLTVKNKKVTQHRRGGQELYLTFKEGERTQCIIGSGNFSGSFEIYTHAINFDSGKCGYRLSLDYESGCEKEKVKLTLIAIKKGYNYEN